MDALSQVMKIMYDGVDVDDMGREELLRTVKCLARDYQVEFKAHHDANRRHAEFMTRAYAMIVREAE